MLLSFYRRFSRKTNVPIAVLTAYTEKEYEPFDSYSRYCPAMPVSVCFFDTALCTPGEIRSVFYCHLPVYQLPPPPPPEPPPANPPPPPEEVCGAEVIAWAALCIVLLIKCHII